MPMYEYKCPQCGQKSLEFMKMCSAADAPLVPCRNTHNVPPPIYMERQVAQVHTDLKDFSTPIEMHSIGCTSVKQIQEMQRAGVSISDDESDPLYGTPIAHNRHEKLKALKIAGFQETK